jgi:hypothetical protein
MVLVVMLEGKNFPKYNLTINTRGARHQTKRLVWQRLIDLQELFMHLLLYSTGSRALNRQREKVGRRCKFPFPYRTNRNTGDPPSRLELQPHVSQYHITNFLQILAASLQ